MKRFYALAFLGLITLIQTLAHAAEDDPGTSESASTTVAVAPISTLKHIINVSAEYLVKYGFQVLGGIIVLLIGWILSSFAQRFVFNFLNKHKIDITMAKFIGQAVKIMVILLAALMAMGQFGIQIAPFIAGLSVIGFGTSFALQGPLSNYAAGITLIFTKPFKVGDIIEVVNEMGEVTDVSLARTELLTVDRTKIIIPNKHIIGEIIHNYTDYKKLDINIGVSYNSDVDKAISLIEEIIKNDSRVYHRQEMKVGIVEFADSGINLQGRLWAKQANYLDVTFDLNRKILEAFRKNKIEIPYPQLDVHLHKKDLP